MQVTQFGEWSSSQSRRGPPADGLVRAPLVGLSRRPPPWFHRRRSVCDAFDMLARVSQQHRRVPAAHRRSSAGLKRRTACGKNRGPTVHSALPNAGDDTQAPATVHWG